MSDIINRITQLAAIMALVAIASPAGADFYQFTFGGEINIVEGFVPDPWEDVHVGSEFEYTYIFDSEAEDHSGVPWYGVYDLMWAQVTIDGVPQATNEGRIFVEDGGLDRYTTFCEDLPIGAEAAIGLLGDDDVIDSDDLLLDINLDDWVHHTGFEMVGVGLFEMYGDVTSFEGIVVPGAGAMPILAYAVLHSKRRRRVSVESN